MQDLGSGCHREKRIVGVEVIHGFGRDELVFNENCGWDNTAVQDFQSHVEQIVAIPFGEIGD